MTIEISDLTQLPLAEVQQNIEEITARLLAENPQLELRTGPLHDLLMYYSSVLETSLQLNIDRIRQSQSLLELEADPTLVEDTTVEKVLSNYRVNRQSAASASGTITIVLNHNNSTVIGSGALFTAEGLLYTTQRAFVAKSESSQINSGGDRLFYLLSDGNYAFNIDVTATTTGSATAVAQGTSFVPNQTPTGFVRSYASGDFSGGRNAQTNQELLTVLQEGFSTSTIGGRVNMNAFLKESYPNVHSTSVIGYGDAEQVRDQHSIWPGSLGGKVDWCIRTQAALKIETKSVTATLAELTSAGDGIWQFSFGRDAAPGFYEVKDIRASGESGVGFSVLLDTRSTDLTGDGFIPDITTAAEGAYSRFQTATIRFVDTDTDVASLSVGSSTATYDVDIATLPDISGIQDMVSSNDYRSRASDILVKAPVPCFVSVNLVLAKPQGATTPDTDAIKLAVIQKINSLGFSGRLPVSSLHDVIHGLLSGNISVAALDLRGRIRRPDGTTVWLNGTSSLIIPDTPEHFVSPKTCQFFLTNSDVGISIEDIPTID